MRLLVSVRDAREARDALEAGADVIDVKEPRRGSLGVAASSVTRAVTKAVRARAPVSVVLGDVRSVEDAYRIMITAPQDGVSFMKFGLAQVASARTAREIARIVARSRAKLVVVAYADANAASSLDAHAILDICEPHEICGIVLDTYDKSAGDLLAHLPRARLAAIIDAAHGRGLFAGVAGTLGLGHVGLMQSLGADLFGVRGAVCELGRVGRLSGPLVAKLSLAVGASGRRRTA